MSVLERNNSIDLFRFIAALSVIMNHAQLLSDINPAAAHFLDFLTRYTVPFFFNVAGFYYIKSLLGGKRLLWKQVKSALKPYVIWTVIYYTASFFVLVVKGQTPLKTFLIDRVVYFFTLGSYSHFWYFTALIYSLLIVTAVFKLFGKKGLTVFATISFVLNIIGILCTSYVYIGQNIPVLSGIYRLKSFELIYRIFCDGFAYFSAGYWIILLQEKIRSKLSHILLALMVAANLAEISLLVFVLGWVGHSAFIVSTYFTTIFVTVVLLRHPLPALVKAGWYSKWLSGFVYYIHPLLLVIYTSAAGALGLSVGSIALFLSIVLVSLLFGFICLRWDNRMTRALLGKAPDKSKSAVQESSPSKC